MVCYHTSVLCTHVINPLLPLAEKVLGIKIRTFGFKGHFKKRSVIIMNHVSHFDWLFFWSVVDRYGDFSFWKVITKERPLRQVPILGEHVHMCPVCNSSVCMHSQELWQPQLIIYYFSALKSHNVLSVLI